MDVYLGGSYEHVDGPNTWPSQQSGVTSAAFGDPPTTTTTTEAPTTTTSAPPSTTTTTTAPAVCGESSHTDENGDTTYERCPVQLAGFTDSTWAALVAFVGVTLGAVSGYVLVRVTRR
jgi:hypothetical protein